MRTEFYAKGKVLIKKGDILIDDNDIYDSAQIKYYIYFNQKMGHMSYEIIESSVYRIGFKSPLVRLRPAQLRRMRIESRGNTRAYIEKLKGDSSGSQPS